MTKFRRISLAAATVGVLALGAAGCASGPYGGPVVDSRTLGSTGGAIAGGLIGSQIGGGRGKTAAIIAGTVLGGLVGSGIAAYLSPEDKAYHSTAVNQTLNSGQPGSWENPNTGVSGSVTPVTPVYTQPVTQPVPTQVYGGQQPQYTDQYGNPVDQYGNRLPAGSTTVAGQASTATVEECIDVEEVVYVQGRPQNARSKYCRVPSTTQWYGR